MYVHTYVYLYILNPVPAPHKFYKEIMTHNYKEIQRLAVMTVGMDI